MNYDHVEAYRRMLTIRLAEEKIAEDFKTNKIFSFYHSSAGQEAVAVGVAMALQKGDRMYGNHRSHGHYIAMGGDLYRMFCEIYGKADGCCKGFGGSMHMLDRSVGFMGSTPLLGSVAPIALGSAFEQKVSGSENITVCFVGDGASEEGVFYESMNIAALKNLPIIFVIEDNLYAVNSPESSRRHSDFARHLLCKSLGLTYFMADGNSFSDVLRMTKMARFDQRGPAVIHSRTFRHMAHSGPIKDESVRKIDTPDVRERRDPLNQMAEYIRNNFGASTKIFVIDEVTLAVDDAWKRAKKSGECRPESADRYVYS